MLSLSSLSSTSSFLLLIVLLSLLHVISFVAFVVFISPSPSPSHFNRVSNLLYRRCRLQRSLNFSFSCPFFLYSLPTLPTSSTLKVLTFTLSLRRRYDQFCRLCHNLDLRYSFFPFPDIFLLCTFLVVVIIFFAYTVYFPSFNRFNRLSPRHLFR